MFYLLHLFKNTFTPLNIFQYTTFRTGGALITAFLIVLLSGPHFIRWLKARQADGQPIREDGPQTHLAKRGTPTMGGLLIVAAGVISTLLWANLSNPYVWVILGIFVGFGLIGFTDDYLKLTHHNSRGISGKRRLLIEFLLAFMACLLMIYLENRSMATTLTIPFFKNILLLEN